MNINRLLMMKSLLSKGWPVDLRKYLLSRCSATEGDYNEIVAAGYVKVKAGRITITDAGKKRLKAEIATRRYPI